MEHPELTSLIDGVPVGDVPLAVAAIEHLPVPATIVEAIRGDDGRIDDFRVIFSNAAAAVGAPDRTETHGKPVVEIVPAFQELGLCERYAELVEGTAPQYTAEDVRITGQYDDVPFEMNIDLVAVPLGADYVLALSHDRTAVGLLGDRLVTAQAALSRRRELDDQLRDMHAGLIDDLVQVRRALETNDVQGADRHAAKAAERAAEVVLSLRSMLASRG